MVAIALRRSVRQVKALPSGDGGPQLNSPSPHQVAGITSTEGGIVHDIGSTGLPAWQRQGLLTWTGEAYAAEPLWTVEMDGDE